MRNHPVALQFIGKEMVLAHGHRVESTPGAESGRLFNFYLVTHTPERKDYLMDNGVADEGTHWPLSCSALNKSNPNSSRIGSRNWGGGQKP